MKTKSIKAHASTLMKFVFILFAQTLNAGYEYRWLPSSQGWSGFIEFSTNYGQIHRIDVLHMSITTPLGTVNQLDIIGPPDPQFYANTFLNTPNIYNLQLFLQNSASGELNVNVGPYSIEAGTARDSQVGFGIWVHWAVPTITIQPASQTGSVGGTTSFTTGASGPGPLSYQWLFGSMNLPAATNSFLEITNVQASSAGFYQVVVSNYSGSVTSSVVTLSIPNVPVTFSAGSGGISYTNGQVTLQLADLTGQGPVIIEAATDLTNWHPIFTNAPAFGSAQFVDLVTSNYIHRFYRATIPTTH